MPTHEQTWEHHPSGNKLPLPWPDHPDILTTLLTSVGAACIFLGLGTLTQQGWLTWVGLVIAAGLLAYHVIRHRQAKEQRAMTRDMLGANLISQCQVVGTSPLIEAHHEEEEPVILALTDDALHLGHHNPLEIFKTFPRYNIAAVDIGPPPQGQKWSLDHNSKQRSQPQEALNLSIRSNGSTVHQLAFANFEQQTPSGRWMEAIAQMIGASK